MSTYLDLKTYVANQLGNTDQTTFDAQRDQFAINNARRDFYHRRKWSFLRKTATLTFAGGFAPLPADFDKFFDPNFVYTFSGNVKYDYLPVEYSELQAYAADCFVYAVDKVNSRIYTNQASVTTLTLDYQYEVSDYTATDATQNALVEAAPDITPIVLRAVALFWLSSERSTSKYQLFNDQYEQLTRRMEVMDAARTPQRFFGRPTFSKNGYQSRY